MPATMNRASRVCFCFCLAIAALSSTACDSGPTAGTGVVDVRLRAVEMEGDGFATPTTPDSEFAIDAASINVRDIEFYLPKDVGCEDVDPAFDCEDDEKIVLEGPFAVDLIDGSIGADLVLPVGTYRRVDVRVDDDADDISFRAAGTWNGEGRPVALELALDFNEDIRFEGAFEVSEETDAEGLLLGLDVGTWIDSGAMNECVNRDGALEDGVVIGEDNSGSGSCSDLENTVRDNVEASGELLAL